MGYSVAERKAMWRRAALASRRTRLRGWNWKQSEALTKVLCCPDLEVEPDQAISVYEPFITEPNTLPYLEHLSRTRHGNPVLVPNSDFLVEHGALPFTPFTDSRKDLPIGLIVVPALALDCDGTRLGRGGGWYDRAIEYINHAQAFAPKLVGVCFENELHKSGQVPHEDHDVRMDFVATPERLIRVEPSSLAD